MCTLLRLSSLPVKAVTTYELGTPSSRSFTSAGFHFSISGSSIVTL